MLNSTSTATGPQPARTAPWWWAALRPEELGGPIPAWAEYVERSTTSPLGLTPAPAENDLASDDWQQALARCLHPLLASAHRDLIAHLATLTAPVPAAGRPSAAGGHSSTDAAPANRPMAPGRAPEAGPILSAASHAVSAGTPTGVAPAEASGRVGAGGAAGLVALGVVDQLVDRLGKRLVRKAARVLVLELARARDRGELAGVTPNERFLDFTHRLVGGSELAGWVGLGPKAGTGWAGAGPEAKFSLLSAYPVLARVLGEACRQDVEGHLELLDRLAEDRESITRELLGGVDPGPLTGIEPGGDPHRGGRRTATLTFANGRRVIYKPRPLDLHSHFNDLVHWLNGKTGLGIRTVSLISRDGYGWLEYIQHDPCQDLADVRRFYHRQGALLALLYVLDGTDMHYENLIAAGDQPVLVDVETLFHPNASPTGILADDPAHAVFTSSVIRTALLPMMIVGDHGVADMSGLGGDAGGMSPTSVVDWADAGLDSMHLVRRPVPTAGASNRPHLDGVGVEPRDHEVSLLAGFQTAYEAMSWSRAELGTLVTRCAQDEVRHVARASRLYSSLLDESTHPDALRDADGHSQLLDLLWESDDDLTALVPHELTDLWAGDIPLFTTRPDSRDLWTSRGTRIPDILAQPGIQAVEAKIAALGEVDLHRQRWLISATLATRPAPVVHACTSSHPVPGLAEADPDKLLAAATNIADEIVASALGTAGGATNWLGLELLDDHHWVVLPMGASLTTGYTGTALFLAEIGCLTQAGKYCEVARDAVRPIPRLLEVLATSQEAREAVGPGLHGLGGISYGLKRLADLLDDAELRDWATVAVDVAARLRHDPDTFPSYLVGAAGGLAAMQALDELPGASRLAARYADELVVAVEQGLRRKEEQPATGFATGYRGVAWALGEYERPGTRSTRYHEAARVAADLDRRTEPVRPGQTQHAGWCSGDAGTALTRLGTGVPVDLDTYLKTAAERPVLADLSLCHGELGAVEPLLWLTARDHPAAEGVRRRRAGLVLAAIQQYGPGCGTPRGVPSPGLLTGLAGIGHGLLRLGFSSQIPSALLLQPAGRPTGR